MIVLWNTLYINAALEQLVREGRDVTSEDVARLSPLVFEHINLLGRYAFSVPEAVTRGELRPLRNPAEVLEEVATPPQEGTASLASGELGSGYNGHRRGITTGK